MKKKIDYQSIMLFVFFTTVFLLIGCSDDVVEPEVSGSLKLIGTINAGLAYGVFADDGFAFITNNDGLVIFDIQNPSNSQKVGSINLGVSFGVMVNNNIAYAVGNYGLSIIDISNRSNPQKIGSLQLHGTGHRISLKNSLVFIATSIGLEIVNISDSTDPYTIGNYNSDGGAWGIAHFEDMVYLADGTKGLLVIDVTNPSIPQKIYSVYSTQNAWDVHVNGVILYLACHNSGVRTFDISNKQIPQLTVNYKDNDGGEALGIWGNGNKIFVADNYGIEMIDVSDISNPQEVGTVENLNGAHDIYVNDSYVYVAEGVQGLIILECTN